MFRRGEACKLSVGAYILEMFAATDANGILTFADNTAPPVAYAMHWSCEDARWLADTLETLCRQLRQIAPLWDMLGKTKEENRHILSPQLLDIWDTYVRMFPDEAPGQGNSYMVLDSEADESYRACVLRDSLLRLPQKGTHPYYVIIRTIRYTRLAFLGAPGIILRNESHRLAEAMAMYHFRSIAN